VFEVFLEAASRRSRGIAVMFQWPVGLWLGTCKRRDAGSKGDDETRRRFLRIGRVNVFFSPMRRVPGTRRCLILAAYKEDSCGIAGEFCT